jgi:hypothetical protein
MEAHIQNMLDDNHTLLHNTLREATDCITPYDVDVKKIVIISQKAAMDDALAKNAPLVSENSELRIHLSFMPVEYRESVAKLQATNNHNQEYRNQRITGILPEDHGDNVNLVNALLANELVRFALCDAEYTSLHEVQKEMQRGFVVRARITTDAVTKIIPKME